jgi:hypothetical protein
MVDRKVVPFDEFYYQLKLTHVFQKQAVYNGCFFKLGVEVGVEEAIVSECTTRVTDHGSAV